MKPETIAKKEIVGLLARLGDVCAEKRSMKQWTSRHSRFLDDIEAEQRATEAEIHALARLYPGAWRAASKGIGRRHYGGDVECFAIKVDGLIEHMRGVA